MKNYCHVPRFVSEMELQQWTPEFATIWLGTRLPNQADFDSVGVA